MIIPAYVVVFSVIILYRMVTWFLPNKEAGAFLFYAKFSKRKILNGFFMLLVYGLLIYIYVRYDSIASVRGMIVCILPALWVIYCFFPEKIYEKGIRDFNGLVRWHDIESVDRQADGSLTLTVRKLDFGRRKIYTKLPEGKWLPMEAG